MWLTFVQLHLQSLDALPQADGSAEWFVCELRELSSGEKAVAKKKRHSGAEIAAKLVQAHILAQEGRTQGDIARALEVSVMTFHRWRKAHPRPAAPPPLKAPSADPGRNQSERIAELQLENFRLRRLVMDLLLEKIKLEETASDPSHKLADFDSIMHQLQAGE
jgi:putative transposase